jgi:hypothetical protein
MERCDVRHGDGAILKGTANPAIRLRSLGPGWRMHGRHPGLVLPSRLAEKTFLLRTAYAPYALIRAHPPKIPPIPLCQSELCVLSMAR